MNAVLLVVGLLVCLVLRVPVAVALLAPSLLVIALNADVTMSVAVQQITSGVNSFPLLAVPLFIMVGYSASVSGVIERLVSFAQDLLAPVRGGVGYVTVGTGLVFSWMSGSATADAAGMGAVLSRPMRLLGYKDGFTAGLIGASATIGAVMPPSIAAIIYGVTAGVSIGALFVAGVVPALLMALSLAITVFIATRRKQVANDKFPPARQLLSKGVRALPVLGAPVIVLGGILGGLFTPTEAAGVAVVYIMILGFGYRELNLERLRSVIVSTAVTTGQIMFIVAGAGLFGWVLAIEGIPDMIATRIAGLTSSPLLFLLLVSLVLLVVGMFLEATAALLIMVPVLLPAALELGIDPLHLGVLMVFCLAIGVLTPPVGLVLYVLTSVTKIPLGTVMRGTAMFLVPLTVVLILLVFIPEIVLSLPELLGFE